MTAVAERQTIQIAGYDVPALPKLVPVSDPEGFLGDLIKWVCRDAADLTGVPRLISYPELYALVLRLLAGREFVALEAEVSTSLKCALENPSLTQYAVHRQELRLYSEFVRPWVPLIDRIVQDLVGEGRLALGSTTMELHGEAHSVPAVEAVVAL